METGGLAETFVMSSQTTWHHISEESSFYIYCRIKYMWFFPYRKSDLTLDYNLKFLRLIFFHKWIIFVVKALKNIRNLYDSTY